VWKELKYNVAMRSDGVKRCRDGRAILKPRWQMNRVLHTTTYTRMEAAMAELHISNLDATMMRRLRERADREGRSIEDLVHALLLEAATSRDVPSPAVAQVVQAVDRLRSTPQNQRYPDIEPVEAEGIPTSELLIRDRRR
jgi:plasmid stability protein